METKTVETLNIFCDGGSRGNPGPAASAFVVISDDVEIFSNGKYLGKETNNVAEYSAVLMALEWLRDSEWLKAHSVIFHLDSELVTKQLNGEYKVKSAKLAPFVIKIKGLVRLSSPKVSFTHVLRDGNQRADALVNETLDKQGK